MEQDSFLIVGGGNVGLATAAHLSAQGAKVYIYSRRSLSMTKTKTVHSTGSVSSGSHPIAGCSTRIQAIVQANGRKLPLNLIICCRGQDVETYAHSLAEYVHSQMNILIICASRFCARVFCNRLRRSGVTEAELPAVADVNTSPFVSRGNADNQIEINALKRRIDVAAQNKAMTARTVAAFQPVFGNLFPVELSLEINLHKCDDIVHIPLLLTAWHKLEFGADHNLYRDLGPCTASLIVELDRDRLAVGNALGLHNLLDICSRYQASYGTQGPSIYQHLQQVDAYSNATVGNPYHRYLVEDLPFGAFPLQALARIAGVETPFLDSCITLASRLIDLPPPWTADFLELNTL